MALALLLTGGGEGGRRAHGENRLRASPQERADPSWRPRWPRWFHSRLMASRRQAGRGKWLPLVTVAHSFPMGVPLLEFLLQRLLSQWGHAGPRSTGLPTPTGRQAMFEETTGRLCQPIPHFIPGCRDGTSAPSLLGCPLEQY